MRATLIIESPYKGDVEKNLEFVRNMCRVAVDRAYAPFASHLFYTQFLDDDVPNERQFGIDCGLEWSKYAREVWFCIRELKEFSSGMLQGYDSYSSRLYIPDMYLVIAEQNGSIRRIEWLHPTLLREIRRMLTVTNIIPLD